METLWKMLLWLGRVGYDVSDKVPGVKYLQSQTFEDLTFG